MKAEMRLFTPLMRCAACSWLAAGLILGLLFLYACDTEYEGSQQVSAGTGSVAFRMNFQGIPDSGAQLQAHALNCSDIGDPQIEAYIYDESGTELASGGPWDCEDHQGRVTGVPAGSNRKAVVMGKDSSGNILYRGEKTGITVTAGQVNDAGEILANLFRPTLTSPGNDTTIGADGFSFAWAALTGAEEYRIEISEDSEFSSLAEDATTEQARYAALDLSVGVEYFWRVRAVSSSGDMSAWSETWSFTSSSGLSIASSYIQYRTVTNTTFNSYRGWLGFTKNGDPIAESDVTEIVVKDSSGSSIGVRKDDFGFYTGTYYIGTWNNATSTVDYSGPDFDTGFWIEFPDAIDADDYTYEVTSAEGETLSTTLDYPGQVALPVVDAGTMAFEWLTNGDLRLTWTNPQGDYDQLRVVLQEEGWEFLYVSLPSSAQELTIPSAQVQNMTDLANPSEASWRMQTRSYHQGMNYARGVSDTVSIPWEDSYEENDTLADAWDFSSQEHTWLSSISGFGIQRDEDWYQIEVTAGYDRVRILCDFTHADGDIDVALYDASEILITYSESTTDDEIIDVTVSSSGTYYIKVYFSNVGNTYNLWWDDIGYDDDYEENDTLAAAYDLSGDELIWLSSISGFGIQRDEDWYQIEVTTGYERVLIDCYFTHADGNIDMELYDALGYFVAGAYSSNNNEFIDYTVPDPGIYYIRLYYGDAGNIYDLLWDDVAP